jgi:hypothetical protein
LNEEACAVPSPEFAAKLAECAHCLLNQPGQTPVTVQLSDEARAMFDNSTAMPMNRYAAKAKLRGNYGTVRAKALKLAALVASAGIVHAHNYPGLRTLGHPA